QHRRTPLLSLLVIFLFLAFSSAFIFIPRNMPVAHAVSTIKVLFDNAHAETAGNADWIISTSQPDPLAQNPNPQLESDWTGGISAWGVALQKTGRYSLMTNTGTITDGTPSNPLDLSNFNVLVLPEPNTLFTSNEKIAILNFVHNGGGLFMIADHNGSDRNNDGADSLHIFNDLMNNNGVGNDLFGIQFDVLNIANENPSNDTPNGDPALNGPFGKAQSSIIRNGTTETLNPADNANVHGIIYRNSFSNTGTTGVFVSGSSYGSGRVLAAGDSSAIDDGTCAPGNTCYDGWDDPAGQDNILFPNGTEWLAGSSAGSTPTPAPTNTLAPTNTPAPISTSTPSSSSYLIQNVVLNKEALPGSTIDNRSQAERRRTRR
ncbi:MAG: hydrolase, partial [Ktedonobacteraceae bacterium]